MTNLRFQFSNGTCIASNFTFFHHHDVTVNTMIHILPMNMFRNMFIVKKYFPLIIITISKNLEKEEKSVNEFLLLSKEHLDISS